MKNKNDKLIYHLLWMLIQYCYESETECCRYVCNTRYNACGHATDTLEKLMYIKILSENRWPETKFIKFELTEKGKLAINYDCIFDD